MASATVDDSRRCGDLHMESLPLVDVRLLSGTELLSLSFYSASNPSTSALDTDLLTPKIDRSVFNESAGSRKQTFWRLRLAPPRSNFHFSFPPKPLSAFSATPPEPVGEDNAEVIRLLKALFNISYESSPTNDLDDENLVSVCVEYKEDVSPPWGPDLKTIEVDVVPYSERKRKRGRPRKNDMANWVTQKKHIVAYENRDGILHANEKSGDPSSCSQIKRKRGRPRKNNSQKKLIYENPDGMLHTNEKSGYLSSCSAIKRRRGRPRKNESQNRVIEREERRTEREGDSKKEVLHDSVKEEMVAINGKGEMVDLVALGNLEDPFGEELRRRTEGMVTERELLEFLKGLEGNWVSQRKKRRIVDADYFGDVLPKGWKLMLFVKKNAGRMWLACRRYISPNGQQFVSCKEVSSYLLSFIQLTSQPNSGSAIQGIHLAGNLPSENLPMTSAEHQDQAVLITGSSEFKRDGKIKCHKCMTNFDLEDEFTRHLLSSHEMTKIGLDHDEMITKDGKYECQFCHKLFEERDHRDDHLQIHISNNKNKVGAALGITAIQPQLDKAATPVLEVQGSTGTLKDSAETGSKAANDKMWPGFPSSEVENCPSMHEHSLLSQDEQFVKLKGNAGTFSEENHDQKDICRISINNKVEEVHQQKNKEQVVNACPVTSLAELKARSGAEMTLSNGIPYLEDLRTDSKEQSCSEDISVISHGNEQKCNLIDNSSGVVLPITTNSIQETVSEIDLASSADENICVVNSGLNCISSSTWDNRELYLLRKSANKEPAIDFLHGPEKRKPLQLKESESASLAVHESGHINDNGGKVSDGTRDEFLSSQIGVSTGSVHFLSSNNTAYSVTVLDDIEQERSQGFFQFSIYHEKNVSSTLEELNHDKGFMSNMGCGQSTGNEPHGVDKSKENIYSLGGLYFSSSKERTYIEKNINTLPVSTVLEGSKFEAFETSRKSGVTTGFSDHARPSEDAISGLGWKNGEENYMLHGFNDTSSPLLQSSGSFPTFDAIIDKGGHDFFSFVESSHVSGVQGMRSGGIEPMEYNFFSDPTSTHSESPKVTSDDSVWMEKGGMTLLPKITSQSQSTVLCSWCGNAFHDEALNISLQEVSELHMCPGCRDRFSTNNHFL